MIDQIDCVVVGDIGVGKTCMLISYTTNSFPSEYVPSVFDDYTITVMFDEKPRALRLMDPNPPRIFDTFRPRPYPPADIVLICFKVTSPSSFENIKARWLPEVQHRCPGVSFLIVGTQVDLREDAQVIEKLRTWRQAPVTNEQDERLAKELKAVGYVECSALTHQGLKQVFEVAMGAALNPPIVKTRKFKCTIL